MHTHALARTVMSSGILTPAEEGELMDLLSTRLNVTSVDLIYRATRDGWLPKDFHRECDDKPGTLVVIKTAAKHICPAILCARMTSE